MAKGYLIARIDVTDPDQFAVYAKLAAGASARHGARALVRGGRFETLEGAPRERNVILEFDSFEKARDYYYSDDYQAAKQERENASVAEFVVVEGVD
ncbi:uncharacterized protein (DUF1330 family) [Pseudochelatococcus lubricantis]|uniref:Uncharacterized protein (DUF1330 family) n=1 Tax=Pseudochelatococcus lubricantis TaxID=1538102 RepID=A0ABX0UV01_9HYPH|nr:DUF1330 domain-containing protein [Pseudochelatococcus lubricantis]NIJ56792.1 uncharacterized protein (DUF1330 family) [Pseudochelatococcus lubricantis]